MSLVIALASAFLVAITASNSAAVAACGTTYTLSQTGSVLNWTTAMWAPTGIPGTGVDDCVILGPDVQVQLTSSLTNPIAGLDIAAASTAPFSLQIGAGGALVIAPGVTSNVNGILSIAGGTLINDGTVRFASSGKLLFSGGMLDGAGATDIGGTTTSTFDGSLGSMNVKQPLSISNSVVEFTSTGAALNIDAPGLLTVGSGGTFKIMNAAAIQGTGTIWIDAGGTLVSWSTSTSTISNPLNNRGSVQTQIGPLTLAGGGTHVGQFAMMSVGSMMSFSGTHTFAAGTSFSNASPFGSAFTFTGNGSQFNLNASLTIPNFAWKGGTIQSAAAQTINLNTGSNTFDSTLGPLSLGAQTTVRVATTLGSLSLMNTANVGGGGTIEIASGADLSVNAIPAVLSPSLYLNGGNLNFAANTSLKLAGGGHFTASANATLPGGSVLISSGGILTIDDVSVFGSSGGVFQVNGGTVSLTGPSPQVFPTTLELDSGLVVPASGATLMLSSLVWNGGSFTPPGLGAPPVIQATNTTMPLPVGQRTIDGCQFLNEGTFTFDPSLGMMLMNGASFDNMGTFEFVGDGTIAGGSGTNTFTNTGLLRRVSMVGPANRRARVSAATAQSTFLVPVNNTGWISAQAGAGSIDFAAGGSMDTGGTLSTTSASDSIRFTGGTFTLKSGTVGAGSFAVMPTATLWMENSTGGLAFNTATLANGGTVLYSSPAAVAIDGSSITNAGTFTLTSDGAITATLAAASFSNTGTFQRTAGTSMAFSPSFANSGIVAVQTGTIDFLNGYTQSGGTTTLGNASPATIALLGGSGTMNLGGGTLNGKGTITGALTNTGGIVAPGSLTAAGAINVSGIYTQGVGGTFQANLGGSGAGQFGVLSVGSSAILNGSFTTGFIGPYTSTAANGSTFQVMTFGAKSGDFTTYSMPPNFKSQYLPAPTPTSLALVAASADLAVTQSASATTILNGKTATVTVTVLNNGPQTATSIAFKDVFAGSATITINTATSTAGGTCSISGLTVDCTIPSLAATASAVVTITLTANAVGSITSSPAVPTSTTGTPALAEYDPVIGNNAPVAATITVNPASDLSVAASGPTSVKAGQNGTFSIVISNAGPDAASSVPITLNVSGGTIVSTSGATCTTTTDCTVASIATPGSATITVVAKAGTVSPLDVGATSSYSGDGNSANNSSSASSTIDPSCDIAVTKSGPISVLNGQNAVFAITVRNNGPSAASGVTLNETYGGSFVSISSSAGATCSSTPPVGCSIASLAVGATESISVTLKATATGTLSNTATGSSAAYDPDATNNSATANVAVNAASDIAPSVSAPASVNAGQNGTFTITVANAGPDAATAVPIGVTVSGGTIFSIAGAPCTTTATTASCSVTSILASGSATITVVATAGTTSPLAVSATSTYGADPTTTNDSASANAPINPSAEIAVTNAGPASVLNGQNATFTITVTNNGPSTLPSASLDTAFTGGSFVSATSAAGPCSGTGPVTCPIGTIAVGASASVTLTLKATAVGTLSATALETSSTFDPNSTNNTATANVTVTEASDVAPSVSAPASINAGQNGTFTITVSNAGPDAAAAVPLTLTLSGGAIVSTSGATCTTTATTASCTVASIAAAGTASVTLVATAGTVSPITLSAKTTCTADPNAANDTASASVIVSPSSDIAVAQSASPASISTGQNAVFTIVITNNGPSTATAVSIADSYTGGSFVSISPTSGTICSGTSPVTCSIATLAAGATETITLTLSATAAGSLASSATVTAGVFDPNTTNNTAAASVSVAASSDLTVATTASPSPVNASQDTTITATIKNLGPSPATNVVLTDTFTGATLVSASATQGSCAAAVNCSLGTLPSGATATVTLVLHAGTVASIANTATVSATEADPVSANNTAASTITITPRSDISVVKSGPASAAPGSSVTYGIAISNAGPSTANGIAVTDLTPAGLTLVSVTGACTAFPCTIASLSAASTATISATYTVASGSNAPTSVTNTASVSVKGDVNLGNNSSSATTTIACATQPPTLVYPLATDVVTSPVEFSWNTVTNATSYEVFLTQGGTTKSLGTVSVTTLTGKVGTGSFSWYVVATTSDCGALTSNSVTVNACNRPDAPVASVVANAATGQTYAVEWAGVDGAASYEIQEATNGAFTDATTKSVASSPLTVTHSATGSAQPFFYRVRAVASCDANQKSGYSSTIRVVIAPVSVEIRNPNANVPAGSTRVVVQEVHIPGIDDGTSYNFSATVDKPWLSVAPPNGVLPPLGIDLQVSADPTTLTNGTFTGTVIVTITAATTSSVRTSGTTTVSVPVSVSLVTPVTPTSPSTTAANAFVIPSVGHLDGLNSQWQSDVRLANTGFSKQQILLTFTPTSGDSNVATTGVKQTTITIDAGATVALDDVARNWFGIGSLGEAANGVLIARPLSAANAKDTAAPPSVSTVIASSRTYSVSSAGTLGQYIPAIPFSSFIGAAQQGQLPTVLSLQQIVQSESFRTNVGIVEAAGAPAALTMSVFDCTGKNVKDIPLTINAFQQLQLNSFLASQGIAVNDGRIEVKVTSGTGRITAYASVVDNRTNDPLLVSGVPLSALGANHYVLPGVADLNNGLANWRSDVRIFNGGTTPQPATLTLYPHGGGEPLSTNAMINPGEVTLLDNAVQSLFGTTNVGGALHIETESNSTLVVSGRTYNACTDGGTYGQFIQAVTGDDAVGAGGRTLNILQVEDSPRYRTNIGIAEVTGQAATAQVTVFLPDSKVAPKIEIPLAANEFRQFAVIQQLGLGNVYNARVSVNVVGGNGKITAYGSVIDLQTQDPTYVPAQ